MAGNINFQAKKSLGFQTLTLSNSTAGSLNSTCASARTIMFSVETNNARVRFDGVAPTKTTGVLFETGRVHVVDFYSGTGVKFQRATGTCKISIQAFKNANDKDR